MDVLEDEGRRACAGDGLHEPARGEEQELLVGRALVREAEEDREVRAHLLRIRLRQQCADTLSSLARATVGRIVLEDLSDLEHLLAERAVPGRFAVRPTAALQERHRPVRDAAAVPARAGSCRSPADRRP